MASEIHKKRTGKGFRISEEIVLKEEMYEEEEDDLPRSLRLLGSHLQTGSADMNRRVEAYISNRVVMSQMLARTNDKWRENEINRLFAQSFPNASQQAQQLTQNMPRPNMYQPQPTSPPLPVERPIFSPVSYLPRSRHRERRSRSAVSPATGPDASATSPTAPTPSSSHLSDPHSNTPELRTPGAFDNAMPPSTPLDFPPAGSAFTTELPNDVKTFSGFPTLDGGYDMGGSDWISATLPSFDFSTDPFLLKSEEMDDAHLPAYFDDQPHAFQHHQHHQPSQQPPPPNMKWEASSSGLDDNWDTFINDNLWNND